MFDVKEGVTWSEYLRTRLSSAHLKLAQMESFIHNLQYGSDSEAALLLVRLRMREDIARHAVVESLRSIE